jgi:hypothetical protein
MTRFKALSTAAAAGLLLTMAFSSPVAAFEVLKQSGQTGDYGTHDPEAKCGYTGPSNPEGTILQWIRVFPAGAGPATGTSQQVSWTVSIQKSTDNGSTWKAIKTAPTQTGTATKVGNPHFTTVKFSFTGKATVFYRAVGTLKWLHNGSTSGLIKMRMTTYAVQIGKATNTSEFSDWCSGRLFD